ncbi:MAG: nuclear transport factor 2 family protein [Cyanobacteria bacterium P01_A01_bin.17]
MQLTTTNKNLILLRRLEKLLPHHLEKAQEIIATSFVWHYFNSTLPEITGRYVGLSGLQAFFQKLNFLTQGTFRVQTQQVIPVGEDLVVVHVSSSMMFAGQSVELDAVIVWQIVGDRITEAWDVPSIFTTKSLNRTAQTPEAA